MAVDEHPGDAKRTLTRDESSLLLQGFDWLLEERETPINDEWEKAKVKTVFETFLHFCACPETVPLFEDELFREYAAHYVVLYQHARQYMKNDESLDEYYARWSKAMNPAAALVFLAQVLSSRDETGLLNRYLYNASGESEQYDWKNIFTDIAGYDILNHKDEVYKMSISGLMPQNDFFAPDDPILSLFNVDRW